MKKRAVTIVIVMNLLLMLFAGSAMAEPQASISYNPYTGALEIDCTNLLANSEFLLLVSSDRGIRSMDDLAADEILLVRQMNSGASGVLRAAVVDDSLPECAVYLGGLLGGIHSPWMIGEVDGAPEMVLKTPGALCEIEEEAFLGTEFQYVQLGNQVERIGSRAFAMCTELQAIRIPASVTQIAADAFDGCTAELLVIGTAGSEASRFAEAHGYEFVAE